MGVVILQHGKPISFHFDIFNGSFINYPTYYKEILCIGAKCEEMEALSNGEKTIIHTDHQPLQYLQSQTKLQQSRHFR